MERLALDRLAGARRLRPEELRERSLFQQLRDGTARLLKPYL
jgi:hypothetical protein